VNSPPLAEREFLLLTLCLEDRERSALRICHHSHAANIFNLRRRHVEFRTKAFRLCGYHIAIGDQQINLPVRWRPGIAKRWRRNSPNELIVIEEMIVVVGGIFIFLPNSPFEKLLIKSAGAILIGCAQVNTEAIVAFRLPHGENGSCRVLHDCQPPDVIHIERFRNHFRAPLLAVVPYQAAARQC
jgi:hypothetical protein